MEEKKNNGNLLTIILFILLLIAVGVICYLLGSNSAKDNDNISNNNPTQEKENNKESENNPTEEKENAITPVSYTPKCVPYNQQIFQVDVEENKYNNIIEYIKDQKNIKISLSYCSSASDEIDVNYELTETEKNNVLNELINSRHHMQDLETGGGACVPSVFIKYERNNTEYKVSYWGTLMESNDGNIYKIIDKSVTNTFTQEYCQYFVDDLGSTIISIIHY